MFQKIARKIDIVLKQNNERSDFFFYYEDVKTWLNLDSQSGLKKISVSETALSSLHLVKS